MEKRRGAFCVLFLIAGVAGAGTGHPAGDRIKTPWADQVDPVCPLPDYPRPQMVRDGGWTNLNGLWSYAIRPSGEKQPETFDGDILVPFAPESALSGVRKAVMPDQTLWYRRVVALQPPEKGRRVLLHFGAVDWCAEVWVNGISIGTHEGGYTPFSFDITAALKADGRQEIVIRVMDQTSRSAQPRGKQDETKLNNPGGICYTAVSGIWQTVWLETVPERAIAGLRIRPDFDGGNVEVTVQGVTGLVRVTVLDGAAAVASGQSRGETSIRIRLPSPVKTWSPDSPYLYGLKVTTEQDAVTSYFGMRKISLVNDASGRPRLALNNRILFQYGLLDQGYWPDGLYTAPTDEALRWDLAAMKKLNFNMVRKHMKIEPARWYYWADRLGLLVWQDMPSFDTFRARAGVKLDKRKPTEDGRFFRRELEAMMDALDNVPSIVVWVVFNEGWGQFDTDAVMRWAIAHDPSRLVDGPSGWTDTGLGAMRDKHKYPAPELPDLLPGRAAVLGEFGGLSLPVQDHLWRPSDALVKKEGAYFGYQKFRDPDAMQACYGELMKDLRALIPQGLAAAVYTQLTDVECELNGLITYDRRTVKLPEAWLADEHAALYRTELIQQKHASEKGVKEKKGEAAR